MHFILLLKRQWFENRKAWFIGMLAMTAVLTFLLLLTWHWRTSFNGDTTRGIFLILLFIGGGLYMNSILKELGNKQKGIWLLLLPAPVLSKVGVAIFYGIIVYLLVYLGLFYTVRELMVQVLGEEAANWSEFNLCKNNFYQFIFTFISFQSIILFGSVYFKRMHFLKTVLVIITGFFLVFNGNDYLLQLVTKERNIVSNMPFSGFIFSYNHENITVNTSSTVDTIVSIIIWMVVPITLWIATWCKIKETAL
ncbi:hypothetical protein LX64_01014 [Chitinophaga skermanii]|uniref:Uncharacterized protein n=1 Tax=Chitinophaga skermanii TaxID=331697 RepID=A0A327QUK8_9BACT|nr:hypothetical protein [Chitinophaga skermanii]RAJ08366.1 hypothetical protein LX64_01014 [Chitinophaga skermanii]